MAKELSEEAKEARRAYRRAWYAANKDKVKEQQRRHWERKAAEIKAENGEDRS